MFFEELQRFLDTKRLRNGWLGKEGENIINDNGQRVIGYSIENEWLGNNKHNVHVQRNS